MVLYMSSIVNKFIVHTLVRQIMLLANMSDQVIVLLGIGCKSFVAAGTADNHCLIFRK